MRSCRVATPPLLIEHMGSTSIPGSAAKPVIDILVLVAEMGPAYAAMPGLEQIGYEFRPDVSNAVRLFLRRCTAGGERTHHLHPDPDGPMIAMYSPFGISNETPCSACTFSEPIW